MPGVSSGPLFTDNAVLTRTHIRTPTSTCVFIHYMAGKIENVGLFLYIVIYVTVNIFVLFRTEKYI